MDVLRFQKANCKDCYKCIRRCAVKAIAMRDHHTEVIDWAGCCPRNDQSNQKIKSTRISRAGSYFKPVLVQVANALIKSKKHSEFTSRYKRIKARRGHKKAIIAICRMILTAIWHILSDLKPYTPEGFLESRPVKEGKVLSTSQALNLLKQRGYIIKGEPLAVS